MYGSTLETSQNANGNLEPFLLLVIVTFFAYLCVIQVYVWLMSVYSRVDLNKIEQTFLGNIS